MPFHSLSRHRAHTASLAYHLGGCIHRLLYGGLSFSHTREFSFEHLTSLKNSAKKQGVPRRNRLGRGELEGWYTCTPVRDSVPDVCLASCGCFFLRFATKRLCMEHSRKHKKVGPPAPRPSASTSTATATSALVCPHEGCGAKFNFRVQVRGERWASSRTRCKPHPQWSCEVVDPVFRALDSRLSQVHCMHVNPQRSLILLEGGSVHRLACSLTPSPTMLF